MLKRLSLVALLAAVGCGDNVDINRPPVLQTSTGSYNLTVSEEGTLTIDASATDPEGDTMAYTVTAPEHGTITSNNQIFIYKPYPNYSGPDSLIIYIDDGHSKLELPVSITVTDVNDAPVAEDHAVSTDEGDAVPVTLTATDVDSTSLTYVVMTPPAHGTLTGSPPNLTYTPDKFFFGTDTFTYQASDGTLTSSIVTVTITVNHVVICGDGIVDVLGGEQCDLGDGNSNNGACTKACLIATCGDGFVELGVEQCDQGDGNSNNGTCTKACKEAVCGDGFVQVGVEQCDDGALNSNNGACLKSCAIATCGDGFVELGTEQCDQGVLNSNNGSCTKSCKEATCGDGFVQLGVEQCDNGALNSNNGACLKSCAIATCGDGFVELGIEQCDQGVLNNNNGSCLKSCKEATCGDAFVQIGVEQCDQGVLNNNNGACLKSCKEATCGDAFVQIGVEQCDQGVLNSNNGSCLLACKEATCGDGFTQTGVEACDNGLNNSNTGACLNSCAIAACGDGFVETGVEQCDNGVDNSNTGACLLSCKPAKCGDGFVETGVEDCDDANRDNNDSCTTKCEAPVCGDGLVEFGLGEECDDGNTISGDGCDASCLTEAYTTTTAVLISDVLNCTTQPANQTHKVAVDSDGVIYAVYMCGSSGFLSVSNNRGQTFSSPFDLSAQQGPGSTELAITQLAVGTGEVATAYVALQDASGNVFLRISKNYGVSWGPLVPIGTSSNTTSGVSLQSFNDELYVAYEINNGVTVAYSPDQGATFTSVPVTTTDAGFDLAYDVRLRTVAVANSSSTAFEVLVSSDNGATFSSPFAPPGQQFSSDWALGNGNLFAVGTNVGGSGNSTKLYVIPTASPTTSTAVSGLPLVHIAQSRAVTADDQGNAYVSSMLDTNGIQLDRLPFGTTTFDTARSLTATGAWPNAASLPGGQGVVVIYTESGSQVWATVQSYAGGGGGGGGGGGIPGG